MGTPVFLTFTFQKISAFKLASHYFEGKKKKKKRRSARRHQNVYVYPRLAHAPPSGYSDFWEAPQSICEFS